MKILPFLFVSILGFSSALAGPIPAPAVGPGVPPFKVRPGYRVELVAEQIGETRFLEFGGNGDLYVSQPTAGKIVTLRRQGDGKWAKIAEFTSGKPSAHGMHYFNGWLWYTQSGAVWRARDTDGDGKADEEVKVTDNLPSGGGHWWRSILVTPAGFYSSIGDSGNLTDETATERQKIWRFNLDGSGKTLFASGLRNTEKLRMRPGTEEIWGADHGSDNYGHLLGESGGKQPFTDHIPGDEFNHYIEGGFYGHPFVAGNGAPRLEFKDRPDFLDLAAKTILPAWSLPAHWAPNGWNFLASDALGLRGDAVIACHGSWNSSVRVGYRVERVMFDPWTGQPMGSQPLVILMDEQKQVLGRPCDIAEAPDGSLFFSDDSKGRIYRLTRATAIAQAEPGSTLASSGRQPVPKAEAASAAAPSQPVNEPEPGEFRTLDYFQNHCARCHGGYGKLYGESFKGKLTDDQLKGRVLEMTQTRAQAPITAEQREQLAGFLRSLRDSRPYGEVVGWDKQGVLVGEATPGSKVWIESPAGTTAVTLEGHSWKASFPASTKEAKLHVLVDGQETVVSFTGTK